MAVGSRVAPTPVLSIICSASSAVILKVTDSACQLLCQGPFEQEDVIKPRSPAVLFSRCRSEDDAPMAFILLELQTFSLVSTLNFHRKNVFKTSPRFLVIRNTG